MVTSFKYGIKLPLLEYGIELIRRTETFMWDNFRFTRFCLFVYLVTYLFWGVFVLLFVYLFAVCLFVFFLQMHGFEIIRRVRTSMPVVSDSLVFTHRIELTHTHTHTHTHTALTLACVECLLPSIIKVWMASDEVNSVLGKKKVIFKQIVSQLVVL